MNDSDACLRLSKQASASPACRSPNAMAKGARPDRPPQRRRIGSLGTVRKGLQRVAEEQQLAKQVEEMPDTDDVPADVPLPGPREMVRPPGYAPRQHLARPAFPDWCLRHLLSFPSAFGVVAGCTRVPANANESC